MVRRCENSLSVSTSSLTTVEKQLQLPPRPVEKTLEVALPHLTYKQIPLEVAAARENGFWKFANQKKDNYTISVFGISPSPTSDPLSTPITESAFIMPTFELGWSFFDATRPVTQYNKESLTTLLELAEEASCCIAVACINRENPDFQSILKSYLSLGFTLVNRVDVAMDGSVLVGLEF